MQLTVAPELEFIHYSLLSSQLYDQPWNFLVSQQPLHLLHNYQQKSTGELSLNTLIFDVILKILTYIS